MPDGDETLQELVERRMRELGDRGKPLSVNALWLRGGGADHWSREILRRIVMKGHTRIGDDVAERLSIAIEVPVNQVLAAAGQRRRLKPFRLPDRANRLTDTEREIVRLVVDGFLGAYSDDDAVHPSARTTARQPRSLRTARALEIPEPDLNRVAARRGRSRGKEQVRAQDEDAERPE